MKITFTQPIQYMFKLLLGTVVILTLTACGLKGDLYLPDTEAHHSQPIMKTLHSEGAFIS